MWERLFIDINHKMVQRQKSDEKAAKTAPSSGQSKKFSLKRLAYDGYQFAKGRAGKMLNRAFDGLLGPSVKPMPPALDYPQKHGYHDMISWQLGDTTKTRPKNPW